MRDKRSDAPTGPNGKTELNEQEKRRKKIYSQWEGSPVGVHTQNAVGKTGERGRKNKKKIAKNLLN